MKTNQRYTSLVNEGPQTMAELGDTPSVHLREDGVRKFKPTNNPLGSSVQGGGQKTAVYYIEGKHDPETVLKKWLQENESVVAEISKWALHQRISTYGEAWKQASRDVLGPFEVMSHGRSNDSMGGDVSDVWRGV